VQGKKQESGQKIKGGRGPVCKPEKEKKKKKTRKKKDNEGHTGVRVGVLKERGTETTLGTYKQKGSLKKTLRGKRGEEGKKGAQLEKYSGGTRTQEGETKSSNLWGVGSFTRQSGGKKKGVVKEPPDEKPTSP